MKFSIYIDQLTTEYWIGKKPKRKQVDELVADKDRYLSHSFDLVDAAIVGLVQDLSPQNEAIRKLMFRGHYLITLNWLNEQLPLLQLGSKGFYRRLRWLRMMGILDVLHKTVSGNKTLAYYRLSKLYQKIRDTRHAEAEKAAKKAMVPTDDGSIKAMDLGVHSKEKSHGPCGPEPWTQGSTNESIKDSLLAEKTPPAASAGRPDGLQTPDTSTAERDRTERLFNDMKWPWGTVGDNRQKVKGNKYEVAG